MIIWQVVTEGWLRLATEQARLSPACRWERMSLNGCQLVFSELNLSSPTHDIFGKLHKRSSEPKLLINLHRSEIPRRTVFPCTVPW